jgi:hypothetical protein
MATKGETVTLRRYTGSGSAPLASYSDLVVTAKVALATPEELVAGIDLKRRRLIFSPTPLEAASWPSPVTGKDAVMIDGTKFVIQTWSPIRMGSTVVRIEAQIG